MSQHVRGDFLMDACLFSGPVNDAGDGGGAVLVFFLAFEQVHCGLVEVDVFL